MEVFLLEEDECSQMFITQSSQSDKGYNSTNFNILGSGFGF